MPKKNPPSGEGGLLACWSPLGLRPYRSLLAVRIGLVDHAVAVVVETIGTARALLLAGGGHTDIIATAGSVEGQAVALTRQVTTDEALVGASFPTEVGTVAHFAEFDDAVTAYRLRWRAAVECTTVAVLGAFAGVITAAVVDSNNRNLGAIEATRSTARIIAGDGVLTTGVHN